MDYAFDAGRGVRVIVLDTVRRDVGSGGVAVAPRRRSWLSAQLRRRGRAPGGRRLPPAADRASTAAQAALALLDADRHVVAALAGDTHHNRIVARHTAAGGYWLVQTASLADYPQQARVLRVREAPGGGTVLETWMLDTAPGPARGHRARARLSRRAGRAAAARGGDGG